jgi:thiamine pyrophosphokinase
MAKKKMLLVFNKLTKVLIGMIDDVGGTQQEGNEYIVYKSVEIDIDTHTWVGDFDSGKIELKGKVPMEVYEETLNNKVKDKILSQLDYYKQINVIFEMLDGLIYGDIKQESLDKYERVKAYINEQRTINERYKQAYKDSDTHKFISLEEQDEIVATQLEGGLHDMVIGPRE